MARIAGIDLPKDKRVEIGLTYIQQEEVREGETHGYRYQG